MSRAPLRAVPAGGQIGPSEWRISLPYKEIEDGTALALEQSQHHRS